MSWQVVANNGIFLPQIGWHLDARWPAARSFVSHAHSDHTAQHQLVLCTPGTARLMAARMPGERAEILLPFGAEHRLEDGTRVVLHPAGHIFGSAQFWAENEHGSLLFTGDFKLRHGPSTERCATPHADTVIMETTFGRPHYVFPPTADVLAAIARFCRGALDEGETPVLFGYSLGKSQELLGGLAGANLPVMLHQQTWQMTRVYEQMGIAFPDYKKFDLADRAGHVVICPPQAAQSTWLRRITPRRTAVITGWALDPGAVFRYQCDAAFPLSDHADYPDLLRYVELVQPKRVLTVHGFAAEFARDLRERGIEAWALGIDNQLELNLASVDRALAAVAGAGGPGPDANATSSLTEDPPGLTEAGYSRTANSLRSPVTGAAGPGPNADAAATAAAPSSLTEDSPGLGEAGYSGSSEGASIRDSFLRFGQTAEAVRHASGKLEKIALLAAFFSSLSETALAPAALFFTGRPLPQGSGRALQLGWSIIKRSILAVSGVSEADYRGAYRRTGDTGDASEAVLTGRTAPQPWTMQEAEAFFESLATARGPLPKLELFEARVRRVTPLEAKYLVKIVTGDLRIGLKEGLVEEAIARAFAQPIDEVRHANMRSGDIGAVARAARKGTLAQIALRPFQPLQFMLASPEPDAAAIVARMGEEVWVEEKYDGIRCQVHKHGARAELFSRDLRNLTTQFPELARAAATCADDFIADGELLAWRDGRALPFLDLQRRLGRRGDDFFLGAEIPVSLWLYDLLWLDGRSLLESPLRERRALLENVKLPAGLAVAPHQIVRGTTEIDAAFLRARERGNEGLMVKDPASAYTPGRRGFSWVKLKRAYATLDVVVTAVEYGHGKRHGVLSDYTFSVRDTATGALRTIGKAYSGLTDVEIARLTEHFLEHTIEVRGHLRIVEPDTVIEVAFDSLQASKRHDSGFALRFPRIVRIRDDKMPADIDTLETCRRLATGAAFA